MAMRKIILFAFLIIFHMTIIASAEPIVKAAKDGDLQTVNTIMVRAASKLSVKDKDNWASLHWVYLGPYWEVSKYLIGKRADLNVVGGDKGKQINFKKPNPIEMSNSKLDEEEKRNYVVDDAAEQDFDSKVDALIQNLPHDRSFSGTVWVWSEGRLMFQRSYGLADMKNSQSHTPSSQYLWGSITKAFVAVLVLQQVEEGRISLDDKIIGYLPLLTFKNAHEITVHQLLNHTSGIPQHFIGISNFFTQKDKHFHSRLDLIQLISSTTPVAEPGELWHYSSLNYSLLGMILERVTKRSYPELLAEKILRPLGMANTGVDNNLTIKHHLAKGYQRGLKGLVQAPYEDKSSVLAAGDMYGTVADLALFLKALDSGSGLLLSDASKKVMFDNQYGIYVSERDIPGEEKLTILATGGSAYGFISRLYRIPKYDRTIIAIANIQSPPIVYEIVDRIFDFLFSPELPGEYAVPKAPPIDLINKIRSYCGWYYFKDEAGSRFLGIVHKDLRFYMISLEQFEISHEELVPRTKDSLILGRDPNVVFCFEKDSSGVLNLLIRRGKNEYRLNQVIGKKLANSPDFIGNFMSVELQQTFQFRNDGLGLVCDVFLDGKPARFIRLPETDIFACGDTVIQFERDQKNQITGFRLRRPDLDGFFGSLFVKLFL
jgi:CubicO group peptidase (beta-lactamase class C family)